MTPEDLVGVEVWIDIYFRCPSCQGKARRCSTCNSSGRKSVGITLPELGRLIAEASLCTKATMR